ncbi:MAG: hypothetical protein MJ175_12840 [Clostridia bacterium]|nr:hypothetical protein [Clostridia bacterium]
MRTGIFLFAFLVLFLGAQFRAEVLARRASEMVPEYALRVLLRMTEEAGRAADLSETAVTEDDRQQLLCSAAVLDALAGLLPPDTPLAAGGAVTADIFRAAGNGDGDDWHTACTRACADELAVLSALLLEGGDEALIGDSLSALSALGTDFAADPVRLLRHAEEPVYTFAMESTVSGHEAFSRLNALIGRTSALFSQTPEEPADPEAPAAIYVFACRIGYGEVSVRGGDLLRLVLLPRMQEADAVIANRVCDDDELRRSAEVFLERNGLSPGHFDSPCTEDRHGVRFFSYPMKSSDGTVLIGVRLSDAKILRFDAEDFYKR